MAGRPPTTLGGRFVGRLDGRIIIITGGAQGIGRAYADGFGREGVKVVIADIDGAAGERAAGELVAAGGEALAVQTDVADLAATERMATATLDRFGRIDGLVNNAAIAIRVKHVNAPLEELPVEEWDRVIAVNLRGPYLCCRAVLPHMKRQGYGKILNIASGTFFNGRPFISNYVASKGGVIGLTRSLAREAGDYGITVNCVAPGLTASETEHTPKEHWETRVPERALKRVEVPEDLVGAAIFFMSSDSDFASGQTVVIDGGIAIN
jgi:3-oxoacyl-[acyl-carrier protein] reductase